jgi:hypothetical protein
MSKGTNCQHLFPNIAILIANKNPEIKKMIYICLGHYAELEQTTALLAINILGAFLVAVLILFVSWFGWSCLCINLFFSIADVQRRTWRTLTS